MIRLRLSDCPHLVFGFLVFHCGNLSPCKGFWIQWKKNTAQMLVTKYKVSFIQNSYAAWNYTLKGWMAAAKKKKTRTISKNWTWLMTKKFLQRWEKSGTEIVAGRKREASERGREKRRTRWREKKGRVVFHELWISEAALSAHRHQLTRREGKGQQHTSNRGGTEWGEKERNSQRIFNLICDWWVFKIRENLTEFARYVMKFCFFFFF